MEPYDGCLAHLTDADRDGYLSTLGPGSDLDHRGTQISETLLEQLLDAVRDPLSQKPRLGEISFVDAKFTGSANFGGTKFTGDANFSGAKFSDNANFILAKFSNHARFDEASFSDNTNFDMAVFSNHARFDGAKFSGYANFGRAKFTGSANFGGAVFSHNAGFSGAKFTGDANFSGAKFSVSAVFNGVKFSRYARFLGAKFSGYANFAWAVFSDNATFARAKFSSDADFSGAVFSDNAEFSGAEFETASELGPLVCWHVLSLRGARFAGPVTIEAAAARLDCRRTRWESTAALRLRYASVDLSDAVVEYPVSVTARKTPFPRELSRVALEEGALATGDAGVRVVSLQGMDAAHLVLNNVDLSECVFTGTVHLDQLRLEGECPLAPTPSGLRQRGPFPVRWTARRTLAEEQYWRTSRGWPGWEAAPGGVEVVGPAALAPVYRQLRKSFEDGRNEPDAADFYYGEMEMRRHDRQRPRAERMLLALYWAVSGYSLRASRALGWLLGAMAATVLVMMLWGLPKDDPKPATTGRLSGQDIALTTDTPDPANPTGSLRSRLTSERWEKSARVVVNSVVFRSSGQNLTTTGTYTEMASRVAEPVLLGLAVLAVRSRVKR
ncbi:pentapeptide repeat-containing protein [Streptomyces sp. NBC_01716]|uniref:pentapeptide repeat-containing protein n=1 Tax=Streptomyces sp. NBC_01716 TaxID=2975917 RepID=UPI002E332030|nr:pentapeptide repeat-containing protein [Streptomyces sp. NBC_01716]